MRRLQYLKSMALGGVSVIALATNALATEFNIPGGDLKSALDTYAAQTGVSLIVSGGAIRNVRTRGAKGELTADAALSHILTGTGFISYRNAQGEIGIMPGQTAQHVQQSVMEVAQVAPRAAASGIESVVVTSSKIKGDIQTVPIAITALSQEQLTSRQIAGGPDLVKEVPNLTFSKTNFAGYNIQIRGIGTQAISVTTDPAVAVAFNDTPFIRNHFFEQEFYDLSQAEVLRGPQGTLYGRNATAGVVNIVSAKPTDQFEAMLSADWGNYHNRRYEGMVNIPIVGDTLDLRVAGEWTKRDGYSFNETTNAPIDGRDLWSSRVSLRWKPVESVTADLIWEHFQESDDRLRSGKQLCKTDFGPGASSLTDAGTLIAADGTIVPVAAGQGVAFGLNTAKFSQGCSPASLYSPDSFQVPNGFSLPFVAGAAFEGLINENIDPYSQTTQSTNLRDIQSAIEPRYQAKNDTLEFNASWNVTPTLTLSSDTGYNNDFLWSTEDYNRFDTSPGVFDISSQHAGNLGFTPDPAYPPGSLYPAYPGGAIFCDPQLGCSDRLVVQDLSSEHAWQLSQEIRLASNFSGPLNFSIGGNYLHYETEENYYVFSNTFTMISLDNICPGLGSAGSGAHSTVANSLGCLVNGRSYTPLSIAGGIPTEAPQYVDPNPITSLDNNGHNYFVSQNPYILNSYAGFGEAYFDITSELKLTAGLRWTDDEKHFISIPSELLAEGYGYPSSGVVDQAWHEWTGRAVANWSPKLAFTDQSMFYASYARGYKAGGANPPGAILLDADVFSGYNINFPIHPLTFKPEFIDAYELGTKNTLLDGGLTLNGDVFFYNYKAYQISQIVDRSSINLNFDATVKGAEIEATYEPLPGLKFSFAGGYEDTNISKNQYAIDLMDRTAGAPGWIVAKPSVGQASNCIIPDYVAAAMVQVYGTDTSQGSPSGYMCGSAYVGHVDPVTGADYDTETGSGTHGPTGSFPYASPPTGYPGFDPLSADPNVNPAIVNNGLGLVPNNGEGFAKPVGGNELPNAPHYTLSLTGDYTMPVNENWAATLHADFYWQSQSWARVFNDRPYDKIRGYSNVNTALILTDASGWQVMGYVKNIFNTTAITGDFLNSDDSGLTTNIFLTDPRLYGVRITKNFESGSSDGFDFFSNSDGKRPQIWLQLGGNFDAMGTTQVPYLPKWYRSDNTINLPHGGTADYPDTATPVDIQRTPRAGLDWEGDLSYRPEGSDWVLKAGIRYGRTGRNNHPHQTMPLYKTSFSVAPGHPVPCTSFLHHECMTGYGVEFVDGHNKQSQQHTVLDFTLGKDVGLGVFNTTGTLGGGVRIAQFGSQAHTLINSNPHYNFDTALAFKYHDVYNDQESERRSFHGIGPQLTWDAVNSVFGNEQSGRITVDWGLNASVLFGEDAAYIQVAESQCEVKSFQLAAKCKPVPAGTVAASYSRSRRVTVPNLGGYVGASVRYSNAKVSFGYRADEFFGAIDGGQDTAKRENRGFYGPYLNLSLGFGG